MINKEKIQKLDIYNKDGDRIVTTKAFSFPRDFFKVRNLELVMIKSPDLPLLSREEPLTVIFEYLNGTRVQCITKVDISTEEQLNFHVDDGIVLEERRNSFKVNTDTEASILNYVHDGEKTECNPPMTIKILNINLGGVFMKSDFRFAPEDMFTICMLDEKLELETTILRAQIDLDGNVMGYGCRFTKVTPAQEEKIARFIFDCQLAEREKRRMSNSRK